MITKTFDYWVICTEDGEFSSSDKEVFDSFEDAFAARMDYADWWTNAGTCWVKHYRISPEYRLPEIIDKLHLHAGGWYELHEYNGKTIFYETPMSKGMIEDLKNNCPLLFKEEV